MLIRRILQSAQNLVYPTIFTLIYNLITYTTLRTNHLETNKNTFTIAKSRPKRLESKSNRRTSIQRHLEMKVPKNLQQKLSQNTESTKDNAIMAQFYELDINIHRRGNKINYFAPLYEYEN